MQVYTHVCTLWDHEEYSSPMALPSGKHLKTSLNITSAQLEHAVSSHPMKLCIIHCDTYAQSVDNPARVCKKKTQRTIFLSLFITPVFVMALPPTLMLFTSFTAVLRGSHSYGAYMQRDYVINCQTQHMIRHFHVEKKPWKHSSTPWKLAGVRYITCALHSKDQCSYVEWFPKQPAFS